MLELLNRLDQLHTTELGAVRIKKNLELADEIDAVQYCKEKIQDPATVIERNGKNFYATTARETITVNASKLSIITAHKAKIRRWI